MAVISSNAYTENYLKGIQSPWGYMETKHPDHALAYSGTCYVAGVVDLGESSSIPNYNFEVKGLCTSAQGVPTADKMQQFAYQKSIEISNFSSNRYIQEYVFDSLSCTGTWITLDSKYYSIDQSTDSSGNKKSGVYTYTFNFDDRTDGNDRVDPIYIRIFYTATAASVSFTATDANPRDILSYLLMSSVIGECIPEVLVDDLSDYADYCNRNGLLLSPAYDTSTSCTDIIGTLMECTNSEYVFSQGKIKVIPYYDGLTPSYAITDKNILDQGEDSISIERTSTADSYNVLPLEHLDRAADYNTNVVYATDEGDIELRGLRQGSSVSHHEIMTPALAQAVAQLILQKQLYNRNQYTVKIGQEYILLEPMDACTLQSDLSGLGLTSVRVVEIKESFEDFSLEITFEDNLSGVCSAPQYATQSADRGTPATDALPGSINEPVMFEAPYTLVTAKSGLEVWFFASGNTPNWGGCNVWISEDGNSYTAIGTIKNPARQGQLVNALPTGNDPDNTNTPIIDLSISGGALVSGTKADADAYNTICWCDGELIAYQNAVLTGTNQYQLSYIRRGVYKTSISNHPAGGRFVRCDDTALKYNFTSVNIGKRYYVKFTSFNIFGDNEQELSDVSAYQYTITGSSINYNPDAVTGLVSYYSGDNTCIKWDAITDRRTIAYEVRKGADWNTAIVVSRIANTTITVNAGGLYWVSAVYAGTNKDYYSPAKSIDVVSINGNKVILGYFNESLDWTGNKENVDVLSGGLVLTSKVLLDNAANVDAIANFDFNGGVVSNGSYTIPSGHIISLDSEQLVGVSIEYTGKPMNINPSVDLIADFDSVNDFDGDNISTYVLFKPQVRIESSSGAWGEWADYVVGAQYFGKSFDFRMIMETSDSNTTPVLTGFKATVYK
jgi:aryl carrier-like protein